MVGDSFVPVPEFYAGKSVFITGGAGYLGKVLLEKLLYSCPNVGKVYIILRDKKNVSAEQRLQRILDLPIFSRLRNERPKDLEKILAIKGDISAHNLNMKNEDLETVINEVSVVFHSAAAIKFNDPLEIALRANLDGTRNVLNLCHLMKKIQVFVHVSTAYCNSNQSVIEERVYPPPASEDEVYKFIEGKPNEEQVTRFLNGRPNTYTFTKAMAEYLVSETHGQIPVIIIRPSIVTPSIEEPIKGWVDNWFGSTGLLCGIAKGVCRVIYSANDQIVDLIPVDYVCNLTLVAATRAKRDAEVSVYNSCSGFTNPIRMRQLADLYCDAAVKDNFNDLPYPRFMLLTRSYWLVQLITLVTYFVAYVTDIVSRIAGNRTEYTKMISKVMTVRQSLHYFTANCWVIKTEKSQALHDTLSLDDVNKFPFLAKNINWKEYLPIYFDGVKKFLFEKKF